MTYEQLGAESLREMMEKSRRLASLGLPNPDGRFDLNQDTGEIVFSDRTGRATLKARVQFIGSVSNMSGTWFWAWANDSLEEALVKEVQKVRAFGEEHGFTRLTTARLPASKEAAEELMAIALRVIGAPAWYRAPLSSTSTIYMALSQLEQVHLH